mmetsp:Transcript_116044/g.369207  ORF Transcript_116044/g.369207 Transcript_116044/m.369207 type:complete len:250 (-) Transcript_116044:753-1502(-)
MVKAAGRSLTALCSHGRRGMLTRCYVVPNVAPSEASHKHLHNETGDQRRQQHTNHQRVNTTLRLHAHVKEFRGLRRTASGGRQCWPMPTMRCHCVPSACQCIALPLVEQMVHCHEKEIDKGTEERVDQERDPKQSSACPICTRYTREGCNHKCRQQSDVAGFHTHAQQQVSFGRQTSPTDPQALQDCHLQVGQDCHALKQVTQHRYCKISHHALHCRNLGLVSTSTQKSSEPDAFSTPECDQRGQCPGN